MFKDPCEDEYSSNEIVSARRNAMGNELLFDCECAFYTYYSSRKI